MDKVPNKFILAVCRLPSILGVVIVILQSAMIQGGADPPVLIPLWLKLLNFHTLLSFSKTANSKLIYFQVYHKILLVTNTQEMSQVLVGFPVTG
jgi:hypothetical protein